MEAEIIKQVVIQVPALGVVAVFSWKVLQLMREMFKEQAESTNQSLQANTSALQRLEGLLQEVYGYLRKASGNGSHYEDKR